VLLQAFLGLLLVFTGHHASELHILYGVLPLVVSFLASRPAGIGVGGAR
jgi:hypothetical protein